MAEAFGLLSLNTSASPSLTCNNLMPGTMGAQSGGSGRANIQEQSCDGPTSVIAITWDRRKPDKLSVFHRLLTVTNLMCLAGNKPKLPERPKP